MRSIPAWDTARLGDCLLAWGSNLAWHTQPPEGLGHVHVDSELHPQLRLAHPGHASELCRGAGAQPSARAPPKAPPTVCAPHTLRAAHTAHTAHSTPHREPHLPPAYRHPGRGTRL